MADEKLTHLDSSGQARMVDVGDKQPTRREAKAAGTIVMSPKAFALLQDKDTPKGDVLAAARIAAVGAAKKTSELIPLCHVLPLESVRVHFVADQEKCAVQCEVFVAATAKTGVEMEAMCAVQVGLLTIYDMLKSADKAMRMTDTRLLEKRGGKSGDFVREGD